MPQAPFNNVTIKKLGGVDLDSTFPTSNLYGFVIISPVISNTEASAIIIASYPNKIYIGKFLKDLKIWQWGDISINYS